MAYMVDFGVFVVSAVVILLLLMYTWWKGHLKTNPSFAFLLTCALVWTSSFALEIYLSTFSQKLVMARVQFLAITFLPIAWLSMAYRFIGVKKNRGFWLGIISIPLLTNFIIWLIPPANWFWDPRISQAGEYLTTLTYNYNFWFYYIHAPYSYGIVCYALFLLLKTYPNSHGIYRRQISHLVVAILLPVAADFFYVTGLLSKNYNYSTAFFSLSCVIIAWSLFRNHYLDIIPMARDMVINNLEDGVLVMDRRDRILDVNPAAVRKTGITKEQVGMGMEEIQGNYVVAKIKEKLLADDNLIQEISLSGENEQVTLEFRISKILDDSGSNQGKIITIRNITERTKLMNTLREQALHDPLTGIYNRRQLMKIGAAEVEKVRIDAQKELSVIMIDLDKFKTINDRHGHAVGDMALNAFAEHCKKFIRGEDIFGRLGGEEFLIVLPGAPHNKAMLVAQRLQEAIITCNILAEKKKIVITASVGVASTRSLNADNFGFEQLISLADDFMYQAKNLGGNQVVGILGDEEKRQKANSL